MAGIRSDKIMVITVVQDGNKRGWGYSRILTHSRIKNDII
jgi:hypothetical protein